MKQKRMTAIAVACGIACAACVAFFMMSVQGEADAARAEALARYGGEQVEAYVATRDIVAGERLDLSAVETKLWVADLLPENAIRSTSDAIGKTATSTIFKGEVITKGRFESERDSLDVPAGKQAVSVPAKAVQAVGGAIRAGMSVDIYSSGDSTTTAIAQNVNVLDTSVKNSGALTSGEGGWITLAVEPDKVQELIAASNKTTLYFTLPGEEVLSGNAALEDDEGEDDEDALADESADASGEAGDGEEELARPGAPEGASGSASAATSASASAASSASTRPASVAEGSASTAAAGVAGGSASTDKRNSGGDQR